MATANGSNETDFGELPGFVAYNLIMFIGILAPAVVMDVLLLIAMFLDKSTPVQIKTIIINLLLSALGVSFALALTHVTALVLSTTNLPVPPFDFCHFIIWIIGGAGGARMIFTAVFSIIVFILVKKSAKAVNEYVLIACCVVLWIASFVLSTPLLSPVVVGTQFNGKAACFPRNREGISIHAITVPFVLLWAIIFGLTPLVTVITMPIITTFYLKVKTVSVNGNFEFTKAMLRFAFFLIFVLLFNFIGQVVPPLVALMFGPSSDHSPVIFYIGLTLMNLSLIPTPVLILVYLDGVRKKLKEMFLCYCIRFRDDMSKADRNSRASISQKRRDTLKEISVKGTL